MTEKQLLKKWEGYNFYEAPPKENTELYSLYAGSERGLEFVADRFFEDFIQVVRTKFHEEGMQVANWNYNYFTASGFAYDPNTGEYGYFQVSDLRSFSDNWINGILIRTAESSHDYSGGTNNYTTLHEIGRNLKHLMDKEYSLRPYAVTF